MFAVSVNLSQAQAAISHIPGAAEKAMKIATRKALRRAKKDAISKAGARYTSPVSIFSQSLSTKIQGAGGSLISRGAKNALEKFQTAPQGRITSRGVYIKATVVRGQGGELKTAFRKGGSISIYQRVGQSRFPIKKLSSVAAPSMLAVEQVREPVMQGIEQTLQQEFIPAVNSVL